MEAIGRVRIVYPSVSKHFTLPLASMNRSNGIDSWQLCCLLFEFELQLTTATGRTTGQCPQMDAHALDIIEAQLIIHDIKKTLVLSHTAGGVVVHIRA